MVRHILTAGLLFATLITPVAAATEQELQAVEEEISRLRGKLSEQKAVSSSLSAQVSALSTQVALREAELRKIRSEKGRIETQISEITTRIAETEERVTRTRATIRELIRADYELGKTSDLEMLVSSSSLSDFYDRVKYTDRVRGRLEALVAELKGLRHSLVLDREQLESERTRLATIEQAERAKRDELARDRAEYGRLLAASREQERSYVTAIARSEAEAAAIRSAINRIISSPAEQQREERATVPPAERSALPYYSQLDPRWGGVSMNGTGSTVHYFGCGITSIAMVLTYYGYSITPGQIARDSRYFFGSTDLIQWEGMDRGIVTATEGRFRHTISWNASSLPQWLKSGPILVYLRNAFGPGTTHFVVVTGVLPDGDYVMHDPIHGPNLRFSHFYRTSQITQLNLITPS